MGGSFSISNLGMLGVDRFNAIINPPQAAILAVGRGAEVVRLGPGGKLATRTVMSASLSYDARAVGVEDADRWLAAFAELMAEPRRMLV